LVHFREFDVVHFIDLVHFRESDDLAPGTRVECGRCLAARSAHRGTSLVRNCFLLGPYSRHMPRALWRS